MDRTGFVAWLVEHFPQIATLITALGIGGGSGFIAKKSIDKRQDGKIKELEKSQNQINKKLMELESAIDVNHKLDVQVRLDFLEHKKDFARHKIHMDSKFEKMGERFDTVNDKIGDLPLKIVELIKK